jgi:hypothetical protein
VGLASTAFGRIGARFVLQLEAEFEAVLAALISLSSASARSLAAAARLAALFAHALEKPEPKAAAGGALGFIFAMPAAASLKKPPMPPCALPDGNALGSSPARNISAN